MATVECDMIGKTLCTDTIIVVKLNLRKDLSRKKKDKWKR